MTSRKRSGRMTVWTAVLLTFAVIASAVSAASGFAAVPKLDNIRVALYLNNGKNYNVTVPSITLTSAKGLEIGSRSPTGVVSWAASAPEAAVRFSPDGYRVQVMETQDINAARLAVQALNGTQDKPVLYETLKLGKATYQVYAGMYDSKESAADARQRIVSGPAAALLPKGAPVAVTGPLHWNAGTFPAEAAARQHADTLRLHGIDAWLVLQEEAGKPAYSVWAGEAADPDQLNAVKTAAAKLLPSLALLPIDGKKPYLLAREDITPSVTGASAGSIIHYSFNPEGQKVWVSAKEGGIQVAEKNGRAYRGSIELSRYNGLLAVVNELPLEEYLVSVVGGEMNEGWPAEALKAQAVSARTYAIKQGLKYQIAHLSDSTLDQAYYGIQKEGPAVMAAVQATAGEVMVANANGSLITPFYYSNGGGMTGDPVEVWGQPIDYLKVTPSPDDGPLAKKLDWAKVVLSNGSVGYIRSDFVTDTGKRNEAGLAILGVQGTGVNVRPSPFADNIKSAPIATVSTGDQLVMLGSVKESNEFAWIRGPYTADTILKEMNGILPNPISGKLQTLEVSKRGPSGRVVELKANGKPIPVAKPDQYRTGLLGAPSTRFEIEETGRYTVLGAAGSTVSYPESGTELHAISGNTASSAPLRQPNLFMIGQGGTVRAATKEPQFRLSGNGYGHGLGMSQWGARGLAELGYDYKRILQYYYTGITITKD